MRRLMNFLHTMGAIGFAGSMAALLIVISFLPEPGVALAEYVRLREVMHAIALWLFLPSVGLTVISGLLAFAFTKAFQQARWALVKLAFGVILFEGSLMAIQGPMQREAGLAVRALSGNLDVALLGQSLDREWWSLWVLMGVAVANVVLAVWRPSLKRRSLVAEAAA